MRGTIVINFTEDKFLDVFPYVDLYMGIGARADAVFNLTNNLFIDVSASLDYELIGTYVDGDAMEYGNLENVLFPLDTKATLGFRF